MNSHICEYGCNNIATFPPRKGKPKWSCKESQYKCPYMIKKNRESHIGKTWDILYGKEEADIKRNNMSIRMKKNNPMKDKHHSKESIQKMSSSKLKRNDLSNIIKKSYTDELKDIRRKKAHELWSDKDFRTKIINAQKNKWKDIERINKAKRSISKIKMNYPVFSAMEELRYNPNKPQEKEIQVRCKNSKCPNSKEQNGWFTPHGRQIEQRIQAINNNFDGSYMYCSDECKSECLLFNKKTTSSMDNKFHTQTEYKIWRSEVLKRANNKCEYCGNDATHCHHSRPQKLEPFFSLDPDYGIACCEKCHYEKGHKDDCKLINIANIICN